MSGGTGSSTGNLNRHLKLHIDKIDPSVEKQAAFMKDFLDSNKNKKKTVIIYNKYIYLLF